LRVIGRRFDYRAADGWARKNDTKKRANAPGTNVMPIRQGRSKLLGK